MNHGLDTDTHAFFYERDFYVLSNFSSFRLLWRGIDFDTSEAAYHHEKFIDHPDIQQQIRKARSAHEAYKVAAANADKMRPDWESVRTRIMKDILRRKVEQHEYVRRKLLQTGSRLLVEDSFRDSWWGAGPEGDGANMLGKLWMEVRHELRSTEEATQS